MKEKIFNLFIFLLFFLDKLKILQNLYIKNTFTAFSFFNTKKNKKLQQKHAFFNKYLKKISKFMFNIKKIFCYSLILAKNTITRSMFLFTF